jgi:hypothetical protein
MVRPHAERSANSAAPRGYSARVTTDLALLLTRRALALWALVHLLVLMALAVAEAPPDASVGAGMPALATVVFAADLARRGERTLLANLGVGLPTALGIALAAAALGEAALVAALGRLAR